MKLPKPDMYVFDDTARVWTRRRRVEKFLYSDGDEIEKALYKTVCECTDTSVGSDELAGHIDSWPFEYHLSPKRHNLLLPFHFGGSKVLEVGAGCGAITRFLGESTADVVALEGSYQRARIASRRCRDLPNVAVYCDNFRDFQYPETFDIVVVVGVLEYAPSLFGGKYPVQSFLNRALSFLNSSGVLILAIENQLGLKYFNGCSEDHLGRLFYGIQDQYEQSGKFVTYGKTELLDHLRSAGFKAHRILYPFPDYKLTDLIVSQDALDDVQISVGNIIAEYFPRDYSGPGLHLFSYEGIWPVLARNKLVDHLANSFLILAARSGPLPSFTCVDWLGKTFSSYRRKPFRTITTIKRVQGRAVVVKERVHSEEAQPEAWVSLDLPGETDFVRGRTLGHQIAQCFLNKDFTFSNYIDLLMPWVNTLKRRAEICKDVPSHAEIPGDFLDCIPRNLVLPDVPSADPIYFDREWKSLIRLPVGFPLFRGLFYTRPIIVPDFFKQKPFGDLILDVMKCVGYPAAASDLEEFVKIESDFLSLVRGRGTDDWRPEIDALLKQPYVGRGSVAEQIESLKLSLSRVMNSRSWRLTRPLRTTFSLVERLFKRSTT